MTDPTIDRTVGTHGTLFQCSLDGVEIFQAYTEDEVAENAYTSLTWLGKVNLSHVVEEFGILISLFEGDRSGAPGLIRLLGLEGDGGYDILGTVADRIFEKITERTDVLKMEYYHVDHGADIENIRRLVSNGSLSPDFFLYGAIDVDHEVHFEEPEELGVFLNINTLKRYKDNLGRYLKATTKTNSEGSSIQNLLDDLVAVFAGP